MGRLQLSCAPDTGCPPSTVMCLKCQWAPGPLESTLRGSPAAIESTIYPLRTVPSALRCRTLRGVGAFSAHPSSGSPPSPSLSAAKSLTQPCWGQGAHLLIH